MKVTSRAKTDRIGVSAIQLKFETMGYGFREQSVSDYGIDAHVEIVENEQATGRLIALQIKSGESWFKESHEKGFIYRGDESHLDYWLNHTLPVLIALYNPKEEAAYWQIITRETVINTEKGWKVDVPYTQQINNESKTLFQQIAGVSITTDDYIILSLRDASHNGAKRYTANILTGDRPSESRIESLIKIATKEMIHRKYYRSDMTLTRWVDSPARVVSLFIYQSVEDVRDANWICRSQWVDPGLPAPFQPLPLKGKQIGDGIVVDWSKSYNALRQFYKEQTLSKEDYIRQITTFFRQIHVQIEKAMQLTDGLENNSITSEQYIKEMSSLELIITPIYMKATDMGIAPFECKDVNSRFKSLISFGHNIVLPFSERGLKTWKEQNRKYIVRNAIQDYQKDLTRFEFELEKIR